MDHFGKRMANLRKDMGMSQAELARLSGIGRAKIMRMEGLETPEDVTLGNLNAVAKALSVQMEKLFVTI